MTVPKFVPKSSFVRSLAHPACSPFKQGATVSLGLRQRVLANATLSVVTRFLAVVFRVDVLAS